MKGLAKMRALALLAGLVLSPLASLPAQAQNVICPEPPLGDSSNRCAPTKFVQDTLAQGIALPSGKIFVGSAGNLATPQTMSGDGALSIAGVFTLVTVNANVGAWGSATRCPSFTVNAKGLITAASDAVCTPALANITGFGTGVQAALANALNGAGGVVGFSGALGTPTSGVATNLTGTAAGLTAGNVTTNANLTGDVTSIGNATTLATVNANVGSFGSATQCTAFTTNGKGLITAASQTTCLPALASITGLGTGVATALAANLNASGGIVSPTPTRAGDIIYWNGSTWVTLAGNNSGTQVFQENASGVPSWATIVGTGTVTSVVAGAGLSTGNAAAITSTGTLYAIGRPQGRLTLQSATPVMATSQSNKATLFYDCYLGGGTVSYFNGTDDVSESVAGCEVSDAMVSAASAGQVVSGQVYDVWWAHGGANRICLAMSSAVGGGGGWASDTGGSSTARGTGYSQLDTTTRPYITNKNAIPNCFNGATNYGSLSANQASYLGTVLASANGQISWTYGSVASGGGAGQFGVWNVSNRVPVASTSSDNTDSWTYSVANTVRSANSSTAMRTTYVIGLQEDEVSADYLAVGSNTSNGQWAVGICHNGTSAFSGVQPSSNSSTIIGQAGRYAAIAGLGLQFEQACEAANNTDVKTFYGDNGATLFQSGMITRLRM